jgi:hypothetical protein
MAQFVLSSRRFLVLVSMFVVILGWCGTARAQGIGFQGGGSLDPGQVFVGTHFETGEIAPGFRFRPGIDGGFGGSYSLASINIEFTYNIPLRSGWALYQGGGPAIVMLRQTIGDTHTRATHAATFLTFGFAHENGFFTEIKIGSGSLPTLKFGVGYTVRKKKP